MLKFLLSLFAADDGDDAHHNETNNAWRVSPNGNPTTVVVGKQVTVFSQDDGWKFVVGGGNDAYFSDAYATKQQAMGEAMAFAKGERPRHTSMKDARRIEREERDVASWQEYLEKVEAEVAEITVLLEQPELNITQLRKPERRIASGLKAFGWQIPKYDAEGAPQHLVAKARKCESALRSLASQVEERITERKAARSKPKMG